MDDLDLDRTSMTRTTHNTTTATTSGMSNMSDDLDTLERQSETPDGIFRVLLIIGGAAPEGSILNLIGTVAKDPAIDLQLVASKEGLKRFSQADVDQTLAKALGSGPSAKRRRLWTDDDDDSDEYPELPLPSRLVRWADLLLVAPCSASLLSSISTGACDTLALRLLRSMAPNKPIFVYPSMNTDMFANVWTKRHIDAAKEVGYVVVGPQSHEGVGGCMVHWQDIVINLQDMATFFTMRQQQAHLARLAQEAEMPLDSADGTEAGSGPSSAQPTRESSPGRKRTRNGPPPRPAVFRPFAPMWHESAPEAYEAGFSPGQQHWQNLRPISTGRPVGLGRAEIDLTTPSWERNKWDSPGKDEGASMPSLNPIIPLKEKWWA